MPKPCLSAGAQVCGVPGAPGAAGTAATAGAAARAASDSARAEARASMDLSRSLPAAPHAGNARRGAAVGGAPCASMDQPAGGTCPGRSRTSARPVSAGAPSGGVSV